jgi:rubredoxin
MSLVVAMSEIPPERVNKRGSTAPGAPGALSTTFFRATRDTPDAPTASLNRYEGGESRYSAAHFHEVDQFQIIMEGSGEFGRHHVEPYYVHFARAYTPYGPLQSDKDTGWGFIVLRSHFDSGAQRFPGSLEKLKQIPDRKPWQVTAKVGFPAPTGDVSVKDVTEIKDEQGLFTRTITMTPNARTTAPDPSVGDGQYVVVVKGSLIYENKERQAPTVVFTKRDEPAFEIQAGAQGLDAVIMNFPKISSRDVTDIAHAPAAGFKTLQCALCAFVYDEEAGMPDEGIPPGTRWENVPETWSCPDCSATKSEFYMIEI